jgi:hypothetical protein
MAVDTKTTTDRRKLALTSLEDLRAEVKRLAAAERAGRMRRTGNWTTGQVLGHLAFWLDTVFDGIPGPKPPFFIRLLGPIVLKRMLLKGLPAGFRMPKVRAGTYGVEPLGVDEGERRMLAAIDRLERGAPPDRHAILGRLTREEWIRLHLRHAELHCSFLHPG